VSIKRSKKEIEFKREKEKKQKRERSRGEIVEMIDHPNTSHTHQNIIEHIECYRDGDLCVDCCLHNLDEFDLKDESRLRANETTSTTRSVCHIRWAIQLHLGAFSDTELTQTTSPASDNTTQREGSWLTTLVRAVKFFAINSSTTVVDL
jgi:hypothetical protein